MKEASIEETFALYQEHDLKLSEDKQVELEYVQEQRDPQLVTSCQSPGRSGRLHSFRIHWGYGNSLY